MSRQIIIDADPESSEIALVASSDLGYQIFRCYAGSLRSQHRRRAVSITGTDVMATVPLHSLKSHPDVRMGVLDKMPDMQWRIGVGQGAGN